MRVTLNKKQYIYLQFKCKQFIKTRVNQVVQNSSFPILKLVRKMEEIHNIFSAAKAPGLMRLYSRTV